MQFKLWFQGPKFRLSKSQAVFGFDQHIAQIVSCQFVTPRFVHHDFSPQTKETEKEMLWLGVFRWILHGQIISQMRRMYGLFTLHEVEKWPHEQGEV